MRHFGALYGVLSLTTTIGGAAGPVGAGIYFDPQGTYLPVFYLFIALTLGIAVVVGILRTVSGPTDRAESAQPVAVAE
jgi:hypothetical protein